MRFKLAFLLSLFTLVTPFTLLADGSNGHGGHNSQQAAGRAPVLLVEVNNSGDVRLTLAVYDDGEAILARKDPDEPDGEICSAIVPAAGLKTLSRALLQAGALRLRDGNPAPNLTRKTVSFFIGSDRRTWTFGNTFNYYSAEGPYLPIAQAIGELINNNFGGCI